MRYRALLRASFHSDRESKCRVLAYSGKRREDNSPDESRWEIDHLSVALLLLHQTNIVRTLVVVIGSSILALCTSILGDVAVQNNAFALMDQSVLIFR